MFSLWLFIGRAVHGNVRDPYQTGIGGLRALPALGLRLLEPQSSQEVKSIYALGYGISFRVSTGLFLKGVERVTSVHQGSGLYFVEKVQGPVDSTGPAQ